MQQITSWEPNSRSDSQEIPQLVEREGSLFSSKHPPLGHIQTEINLAHTVMPFLLSPFII
jgi:hypothetical protein